MSLFTGLNHYLHLMQCCYVVFLGPERLYGCKYTRLIKSFCPCCTCFHLETNRHEERSCDETANQRDFKGLESNLAEMQNYPINISAE